MQYVEFMAWRKICMENLWHSKYVYLKMVKVEKGRVQVGEVLQSNSFSSSAKTWSKWQSDLFLRISFGKYSFCINPFLFMSPSNFCQSCYDKIMIFLDVSFSNKIQIRCCLWFSVCTSNCAKGQLISKCLFGV